MRVLLSLLFLAAACSPALGALFAVDLGSEFLKMSIVKPGRIPISIVNNEMSKRKTPALVAFVDGERLVGEEAASLVARYPDKIYGRLRDMLGRPADHPGLLQALDRSHLHYKLVPAPNRTEGLAVETDTGKAYSAEELVVSEWVVGSWRGALVGRGLRSPASPITVPPPSLTPGAPCVPLRSPPRPGEPAGVRQAPGGGRRRRRAGGGLRAGGAVVLRARGAARAAGRGAPRGAQRAEPGAQLRGGGAAVRHRARLHQPHRKRNLLRHGRRQHRGRARQVLHLHQQKGAPARGAWTGEEGL